MKFVIFLIVLSIFGVAHAERAETAKEWLVKCQAPSNNEYCKGFITGMLDVGETYAAWMEFNSIRQLKIFCVPAGEPLEKVLAVITKFIEDRPNEYTKSSTLMTIKALEYSYRCGKTK